MYVCTHHLLLHFVHWSKYIQIMSALSFSSVCNHTPKYTPCLVHVLQLGLFRIKTLFHCKSTKLVLVYLICLNKPHQRGIRTRVRFKWTKWCICESILRKLARKVHIASGADYRCAYRLRSHRTQKQSHEWKSFTLMWGRASGQI